MPASYLNLVKATGDADYLFSATHVTVPLVGQRNVLSCVRDGRSDANECLPSQSIEPKTNIISCTNTGHGISIREMQSEMCVLCEYFKLLCA